MSHETVYLCDRCGVPIGAQKPEHLIQIRINDYEARDGEYYIVAGCEKKIESEDWDLCLDCGRAVITDMREAMQNAQ